MPFGTVSANGATSRQGEVAVDIGPDAHGDTEPVDGGLQGTLGKTGARPG